MYAWENPGVPVDEVLNDVLRAFHHPAARNEQIEIQREMFETVRKWAQETPYRSRLDHMLSSESVKNHNNHILSGEAGSRSASGGHPGGCGHGSDGGHGKPAGSLWSHIQSVSRDTRELGASPAAGGGGHHPPPQMHGQASAYYTGSTPQTPQSYAGTPGSAAGYAASYGQPTPPPAQPPYGGHQGYPGQGGYGQQHHQHQPPPPQQPQYGGHPQGGAYDQPQHPGAYPPHGQQPPSWGGHYPRY
jgi:hypothetical protein